MRYKAKCQNPLFYDLPGGGGGGGGEFEKNLLSSLFTYGFLLPPKRINRLLFHLKSIIYSEFVIHEDRIC